jgi:hypothetical protein
MNTFTQKGRRKQEMTANHDKDTQFKSLVQPELEASTDQEIDVTSLDVGMTRQEFIRKAALAGILLTIPWASTAEAKVPRMPAIKFRKNKTRDGIIGPYGEVRIFEFKGEAVPLIVEAVGGLAVMDITARSPFVRFGASTDATAITLTSAGVAFGKETPVKWSPDVIRKLVAEISKDPAKARGALYLRSALQTSYPVAITQMSKGKMGKKMATAMANASASLDTSSMKCTTKEVTETVTEAVSSFVNVWKTAEEQYQECYDRLATTEPCSFALIGAGVCAAIACGLVTFVDMVVGVVEIVETVVKEVTRTVVSCVLSFVPKWPNPWGLGDLFPLNLGGIAQPVMAFSEKDIGSGLKLLKDIQTKIGGFLGPFACLLDGEWSLAQLDTRIDFGGGNIAIPYGIKVCISSACATALMDRGMIEAGIAAWDETLVVLAALSTDIAALGIPADAAGAALIAALGGPATAGVAVSAGVAVAAIILALILLIMIYATAIWSQLIFQKNFTSNFDDGKVCIEHPTFALALIKIATLGIAPSELIPPIVTG